MSFGFGSHLLNQAQLQGHRNLTFARAPQPNQPVTQPVALRPGSANTGGLTVAPVPFRPTPPTSAFTFAGNPMVAMSVPIDGPGFETREIIEYGMNAAKKIWTLSAVSRIPIKIRNQSVVTLSTTQNDEDKFSSLVQKAVTTAMETYDKNKVVEIESSKSMSLKATSAKEELESYGELLAENQKVNKDYQDAVTLCLDIHRENGKLKKEIERQAEELEKLKDEIREFRQSDFAIIRTPSSPLAHRGDSRGHSTRNSSLSYPYTGTAKTGRVISGGAKLIELKTVTKVRKENEVRDEIRRLSGISLVDSIVGQKEASVEETWGGEIEAEPKQVRVEVDGKEVVYTEI